MQSLRKARGGDQGPQGTGDTLSSDLGGKELTRKEKLTSWQVCLHDGREGRKLEYFILHGLVFCRWWIKFGVLWVWGGAQWWMWRENMPGRKGLSSSAVQLRLVAEQGIQVRVYRFLWDDSSLGTLSRVLVTFSCCWSPVPVPKQVILHLHSLGQVPRISAAWFLVWTCVYVKKRY